MANSPSAILPTYFAFRYLIVFFFISVCLHCKCLAVHLPAQQQFAAYPYSWHRGKLALELVVDYDQRLVDPDVAAGISSSFIRLSSCLSLCFSYSVSRA